MRFTAYFDPRLVPMEALRLAVKAEEGRLVNPGQDERVFRVTECNNVFVSSEDCNAVMRVIGRLAAAGFGGLYRFTGSKNGKEE